jgi:hypothetical protein
MQPRGCIVSTPISDTIEKKIRLKVPRQRTWQAITTELEFAKWFGAEFLDGKFELGNFGDGWLSVIRSGRPSFVFRRASFRLLVLLLIGSRLPTASHEIAITLVRLVGRDPRFPGLLQRAEKF